MTEHAMDIKLSDRQNSALSGEQGADLDTATNTDWNGGVRK